MVEIPQSPNPRSAWEPFTPGAAAEWNVALAGHLWRRAACGATWTELQESIRRGPEATLARLLDPGDEAVARDRQFDQYEAAAASGAVETLRAWWLWRMIETRWPLRERMTLFWYDFFGLGASRVKNTALVARHLAMLRAHSLGNFADLLRAAARDPALLVSLGAEANRRARPSELLARRWLARYTVGPEAFGDEDVASCARAWTGWFVLRGELRYFEREYDDGPKRLLGREGRFDDQGVVEVLLTQPATARNVVRRLYRWLVSEVDEPDDTLVAPLAERFAKDYQIAPLVGAMLGSRWFFSAAAYRRRVKSPVELAVGLLRSLEAAAPTLPLGDALAELGQNLLEPPTFDGWSGGADWLNRAALLERYRLLGALLGGGQPYGQRVDPAATARRHAGEDPSSAAPLLVELMLDGRLEPPSAERVAAVRGALEVDRRAASKAIRDFAGALALLPEYQLA